MIILYFLESVLLPCREIDLEFMQKKHTSTMRQ